MLNPSRAAVRPLSGPTGRQVVGGLGALCVLVVGLVGIPIVLAALIGWPLPHHVPSGSQAAHAFGAAIPDSILAATLRHLGVAGLGLFRVLVRRRSCRGTQGTSTRSPLPALRLGRYGGPHRRCPDPRSVSRCSHSAHRGSGEAGPRSAAAGPDDLSSHPICSHVSRPTIHRLPHCRARRHVVEHCCPVLRRRHPVASHLPGQRGPSPARRWSPHRCSLDLPRLVPRHSCCQPVVADGAGNPCADPHVVGPARRVAHRSTHATTDDLNSFPTRSPFGQPGVVGQPWFCGSTVRRRRRPRSVASGSLPSPRARSWRTSPAPTVSPSFREPDLRSLRYVTRCPQDQASRSGYSRRRHCTDRHRRRPLRARCHRPDHRPGPSASPTDGAAAQRRSHPPARTEEPARRSGAAAPSLCPGRPGVLARPLGRATCPSLTRSWCASTGCDGRRAC